MNLFVTGTSTEVGKTYVSCLVLQALVQRGDSVTPFKPVCCGERSDVFHLLRSSERSDLSPDDINPLWLQTPASPFAAALIENRAVRLDELVNATRALEGSTDHLLVEGAGGWEVPLNAEESLSDLAAELGYPVLVVVDNKLGALNHTILTVRAIRERGLPLLGIVLNQTEESRDAASISNRHILEEYLQVPILAELLHDASEMDVGELLRSEFGVDPAAQALRVALGPLGSASSAVRGVGEI